MSSTIFHLEMIHQGEHRVAVIPEGLEVARVEPPAPVLNARFYREVGADWSWTDRLSWSPDEWEAYVQRDELETWCAIWKGEEAGYFELEQQDEGSVEIIYFGLLPGMIGLKLGGAMLTLAIERAWRMPGTRRVWVHTCTEDHEHALANYERRGFQLFKTEEVISKS